MADNESVFQEQIGVSLDLNSFEAQLSQMADMWQGMLSKMGSNGPGLVDTLNIASINNELKDLQGTLSGFLENFTKSLGNVGEEMNNALAKANESADKALSKVSSPSGGSDAKKQALAQDIEIENQGIRDQYVAMWEKALAERDTLEEQSNAKIASLQEELASLFVSKWESALEKRDSLQNSFDAKWQAAEEKKAARQIALAEEIAMEQEGIVNKYQAEQEAAAAKQAQLDEEKAAREIALARDIDIEREGLLNKQAEQAEAAAAKQAQLDEEKAARQIALAKEIAMEQEGIVNKYQAEQEAAAKKSSEGNFLGTLMGTNIGQALANVVKFQLLWGLVGEAVHGVGDAIMSPIRMLEEGVNYLSLMEEKANELSGVLASSFNFSSDFAKNMQIAGEASTKVVAQLRQVSSQTGLGFDQLTTTFKALSNAGIGNMTTDLNQVVQLSAQFASLLKAAGVNSESARRILGEIPKLMSDSVTGNELLLRSLGLSKDQWTAIRAEALQHKDLLQALAPYMEPYIQQLKNAEGTFTSLKEQAKQAFDEDAAAASSAIFDKVKGSIAEIVALLKDSKSTWGDIGTLVGDAVVGVGHLIGALTGANSQTDTMRSAWVNIGSAILEATASVAGMIEKVSFLMNVVRSEGNVFSSMVQARTPTQLAGAFAQAGTGFEQAREQTKKNLEKISDDLSSALLNLKENVHDVGTTTDQYTYNGGKNTPPGKEDKGGPSSELSLLNEKNRDNLSTVRNSTQRGIDIAKQDFAERKIGEQDLHDIVVSLLKDEKARVDEIMASYKTGIASIKGLKPEQKQKALDAAGRIGNDLDFHTGHEISQANIQLGNEQHQREMKALQDEYAFKEKMARFDLEMAKLTGASKEDIARKEAAANDLAFQAKQTQLQEQYKSAGPDDKPSILKALNNSGAEQYKQSQVDAQKINDARIQDQLQQARESMRQMDAQYAAEKEATEARGREGSPEDQYNRAVGLAASDNNRLKIEADMIASLLKMASATDTLTGSQTASEPVIKELTALYEELTGKQQKTAEGVKKTNQETPTATIFESIFGPGMRSWSDFGMKTGPNGTQSKFDPATASQQTSNALQTVIPAVKSIVGQFQQGGARGVVSGIGSIASTAAEFDPEPISHAALQIAGTLLSAISDAFSNGAKHIAERIQGQFNMTMTNLGTGGITSAQAIAQIQAEEADAISQLSGKKGGQAQLSQMLPQMQQQLYQLQMQALEYVRTMNFSIATLSQGGLQPLQDMVSLWTQMNQQVQNYITAGGDAATAQQYVSESLQNMQRQLTQTLTQEQAGAVNDALQLNQLLQQRIDLETKYAQQQFNSVNADALERRASYAITTGTALQSQQHDYQIQLTDINNQIALYQQKTDLESQMFQIAQDRNSLELEGNALQIEQLQTQLLIYKQQMEIVQGITQTPQGYMLTQQLSGLLNNGLNISTPGSPINIQVTVNGNGDPAAIQDSVYNALTAAGRYGTGTGLSTFNNPG